MTPVYLCIVFLEHEINMWAKSVYVWRCNALFQSQSYIIVTCVPATEKSADEDGCPRQSGAVADTWHSGQLAELQCAQLFEAAQESGQDGVWSAVQRSGQQTPTKQHWDEQQVKRWLIVCSDWRCQGHAKVTSQERSGFSSSAPRSVFLLHVEKCIAT